MKKIFAFTLAEVLIAMTIVGVIAGMTIPTLHYQRVKKEYSSKLKNFYSHMESAIMDMQLDYGSYKDMTQPDDGFEWYMKHIDPYMGHQLVSGRNVYFKDGSKLTTFYKGGCLDVDYVVNGDKGKRQGIEKHRFLYCFTDSNREAWFGSKDIFFGTYGSDLNKSSVSRDTMIAKCKTDNSWCTRLLQNDQWEFKTDYPLRF